MTLGYMIVGLFMVLVIGMFVCGYIIETKDSKRQIKSMLDQCDEVYVVYEIKY